MEDKEILEVINAVSNIEADIYESTKGVEYFNVSCETNGYIIRVVFLGLELWNSDDDMRDFNEMTDEYEPIEPFLRRILNKELEKIKKIVV